MFTKNTIKILFLLLFLFSNSSFVHAGLVSSFFNLFKINLQINQQPCSDKLDIAPNIDELKFLALEKMKEEWNSQDMQRQRQMDWGQRFRYKYWWITPKDLAESEVRQKIIIDQLFDHHNKSFEDRVKKISTEINGTQGKFASLQKDAKILNEKMRRYQKETVIQWKKFNYQQQALFTGLRTQVNQFKIEQMRRVDELEKGVLVQVEQKEKEIQSIQNQQKEIGIQVKISFKSLEERFGNMPEKISQTRQSVVEANSKLGNLFMSTKENSDQLHLLEEQMKEERSLLDIIVKKHATVVQNHEYCMNLVFGLLGQSGKKSVLGGNLEQIQKYLPGQSGYPSIQQTFTRKEAFRFNFGPMLPGIRKFQH